MYTDKALGAAKKSSAGCSELLVTDARSPCLFRSLSADLEALPETDITPTGAGVAIVRAGGWSRRALALAVTTQVRRYCNSSFTRLAVQFGCKYHGI